MKLPLTVVIPTLNEASQIAEALGALGWADEIIVADGGSTDGTPDIARARGARVLAVPGATIAAQRNAAIRAARNEWVLALDADERVPDALRDELAATLAAPAHAASRVHERLEPVADVGALRHPIRHVPYRDLTHHVEKMLRYARAGAQDLHARGRRASVWDLWARPLWRFVRDYVVHGSCLDGRAGFVASVLTAYAGFLKYAYLWELDERPPAAR